MSTPVVAISPVASVEQCCQLMEEKRVRRVLVEEKGVCSGIVAQADIARQMPERKAGEVVRYVSEPIEQASRAAFP